MTILDCGGKRSATPLWVWVEQSNTPYHSKAPSPLRFAGAVQRRKTSLSVQADVNARMFESWHNRKS
jgi:hypothetical protein